MNKKSLMFFRIETLDLSLWVVAILPKRIFLAKKIRKWGCEEKKGAEFCWRSINLETMHNVSARQHLTPNPFTQLGNV